MGMPVPAEPEMIESWNFVSKVICENDMLFLTYLHGKGVKKTIGVKKAIIFRRAGIDLA